LKKGLSLIKNAVYSFEEFKNRGRAEYTILKMIYANFELKKLQIYFHKK